MSIELDNLWKLHRIAWKSFERRSQNEFKFCFGVWTAEVALIGISLTSVFSPPSKLLIFNAMALLIIFHLYYELGMTWSNNTDLRKCYEIEKEIRDKSGYNWSDNLRQRIENRKWYSKNWSHFVHVGITFTLAVIIGFLLWQ